MNPTTESPSGLRFTVLASGSRGNSFLVQSGGGALLVDAGLSVRRMEERLLAAGCALEALAAVVITHEHHDHIAGLDVLARRCPCPVFCNAATDRALRRKWPTWQRATLFVTGDEWEPVAGIRVRTFPVPHDAEEPVGLVVESGGARVGLLTDLGFATALVLESVRGVNALVLETNYDEALLRADQKRPWPVKQRIMARHGHLSNGVAAALLSEVAGPGLRHVFLAHLSEDCNRPELAEQAVRAALSSKGMDGVAVHRTCCDRPTATIHIADPARVPIPPRSE